MNPFRLLLPAVALAPLLLAAPAAEAAESYDSCKGTITSLPAIVATPGTWCLSADLATSMASGAAIQIATSNVTIDCNGFRLSGLGAGDGTATAGILATNKLNIGVRNCHVRGFKYGVQGQGTAFLIEDNRIEGSTQRGVSLIGDANIVRRNQVTDTGGSTAGLGAAYGLHVTGSSELAGNHISGVVARVGSGQGAWGIHVADDLTPAQIVIADNSVRNLVRDGAGTATGIRSVSTGRVTLRDNAVFGPGTGIGLQCANDGGSVRGNSILAFGSAIVGCSNDVDNVVKP
jgi:hypothetical protein